MAKGDTCEVCGTTEGKIYNSKKYGMILCEKHYDKMKTRGTTDAPEPHYTDIAGERFGRLLAIERIDGKWLCECDCGNKTMVNFSSLNRGDTKSCGCIKRELVSKKNTTHGYSKTPTYNTWRAMKERCENPGNKRYHEYHDRGITVCDEWHSFENFLRDMGKRPEGTTLERLDNDLGYYKDNCKWATNIEQANNRRNNHVITYENQSKTLMQWSRLMGIHRETLRARLKQGWDIGRTIEYYGIKEVSA